LDVGKDLKIDPNDALAVLIMEMMDVSEIYSFDTDFDKVNVTRLPYI
jgi:predicted nucleic acid-binding protein